MNKPQSSIDEGKSSKAISTWSVSYSPPITLFDVDKIKAEATRWEKLRLKLRPKQHSIDGDYIIVYKQMDGKHFVLKSKIRKIHGC